MIGLLEAIARQEGFYVAGTRAQRNCNPGNITWGAWARAHGAIHAEAPLGRYAVFASIVAGFQAMEELLQSPGYINLSLAQVLERWAPPNENATKQYIADVCEWTGLQSTTPLHAIPLTIAPASLGGARTGQETA